MAEALRASLASRGPRPLAEPFPARARAPKVDEASPSSLRVLFTAALGSETMAVSLRDLRAVYDPEMHLAMLRDARRNDFYRRCLQRHPEFRGHVAVDVGAGCGVLSAMAVAEGIFVHAVEALPEVARLIEQVLRHTGQARGT